LEDAKKHLTDLTPMLEEKHIKMVEPLLYDIGKVYDVERALQLLDKKADLAKKKMEREKASEMGKEMEARKKDKEREEKAEQVYDLVIKHQTGKAAQEEEPEGKHFIAKLRPNYVFDNFVVGNSNHFAHAAAMAVAEEPATTYNPLFIWSGPGLGKTHLLNAIANHIMDQHPTMKITYFTTEQFIQDLVRSMKDGKLDEFRRTYRESDILIVDDVQFLAESEHGQEEFFHTFNALYTVDKQIVLASDRPPKEIATLKQRLVSRFEGGLIVEIQPPDYETRLAILQQKTADKEIEIGDEVLALIARSITNNIRELEGGLNKVVAFSSFTKRKADIDLAREVLKDILAGEEESEEEEEEKKPAKKKSSKKKKEKKAEPEEETTEITEQELQPGHSYLVEEPTLRESVKLFKDNLSEGDVTGLAIIRTNPTRVEKEHKIKHLADLYWLTDRESKKNKTIEPSLEKLMWELATFLDENDNGILLLDGLDYLASANTFDAVTQFIRRVVDTVAESDGVLIVSLSPDTMDKQQVKILEREMDVIRLV